MSKEPHAKNPAIANFFAQLGIVEELGRGTRALYEYVPKISGGRMPVIEEMDEFKVVIPYQEEESSETTTEISKEKGKEKSKEKSKEKVLALIKDNNQITTRQLMSECQLSENAIYKIIRQLRESGYIEREGGRKEGSWKVLK